MGLFEFVLDDFEPFTSSRKIVISGNAFAFEGSRIVFIFVFFYLKDVLKLAAETT